MKNHITIVQLFSLILLSLSCGVPEVDRISRCAAKVPDLGCRRWPPILCSNGTGPKTGRWRPSNSSWRAWNRRGCSKHFHGDALAIPANVSSVSYKKLQNFTISAILDELQACQVVFPWIPRPSPSCSRQVNGNRRAISVSKREILVKHVKSLQTSRRASSFFTSM